MNYVIFHTFLPAPTRITDPPRSQSVNAADDVTLQCGATTDRAENLTVEWLWNGRRIDFRGSMATNLRYNPSDHSLVISDSLVANSGEYSCRAGNGLDSVESPPARIVVKGLTSITLYF